MAGGSGTAGGWGRLYGPLTCEVFWGAELMFGAALGLSLGRESLTAIGGSGLAEADSLGVDVTVTVGAGATLGAAHAASSDTMTARGTRVCFEFISPHFVPTAPS